MRDQQARQDEAFLLAQGFTQEEINSIVWLQHWYQSGGSDRAEVLRRLEFLRRLHESGKLES